jgi:predicted anti-sigma-YlaC factor YlaD
MMLDEQHCKCRHATPLDSVSWAFLAQCDSCRGWYDRSACCPLVRLSPMTTTRLRSDSRILADDLNAGMQVDPCGWIIYVVDGPT